MEIICLAASTLVYQLLRISQEKKQKDQDQRILPRIGNVRNYQINKDDHKVPLDFLTTYCTLKIH